MVVGRCGEVGVWVCKVCEILSEEEDNSVNYNTWLSTL